MSGSQLFVISFVAGRLWTERTDSHCAIGAPRVGLRAGAQGLRRCALATRCVHSTRRDTGVHSQCIMHSWPSRGRRSRCLHHVCRPRGAHAARVASRADAFIAATLAARRRRTERPVKSILAWVSQKHFPGRWRSTRRRIPRSNGLAAPATKPATRMQGHPINFWEQTVRCFHCGRDRFHVQASCSCHGGRVMHDSCLPPELLRLAENESLSKASRPLKEMTCFCTMALQKGTHRCADFDSTRPRLTRPVSTRLDSTRLDPRLVPASSCLQASRCVCRSGGLESNAFIAATLAALHRRTDRPVKSILEWHSQRFPDRCPHM